MALPTLSGEFGVVKVQQLRFQPNGDAVLSMRLAADNSKYDRQTQSRTEGDKKAFVDISLWRQDAEAVAELNLQPGQKITISGPMYVREYDNTDGTKGKAVTVDAYAFGIKPKSVAQGGNQQNRQQQPQQNQNQQNQQNPMGNNPWPNQQNPQQNQNQQNQQQPQQNQQYQNQNQPQQNQQNQQGGWPQPGNDEPPF